MADTLQALQALGQSPWLDFITRDLLRSGKLAALVRAGEVTGLTSNPTIFEQAITGGVEYDDALEAAVRAGKATPAIVDGLMIEDIRAAADVFAPVYQRTKRADGYVSIEVDPALARDAAGTVREARRLWRAVNRPNLLVKIPATAEGVPAIEEAIASGINVNVTLIFSLARYEQVMEAYVNGLTRRLEAGTRVDRLSSVASFFVSRVDTAVDRLLEERIAGAPGEARAALERLRGKAAIANAKLAYVGFRERFGGDRFALLAREGARPQRPLWASTSTKNPRYPDVYYVEALVGPDTVNTLPPATLDAYRDHGRPERRIDAGVDRAREALAELRRAGIDLDAVTTHLEREGVASFEASHRSLLDAVATRREACLVMQRTSEELGALGRAADLACRELDAASVPARLVRKDTTLWPTAAGASADRLAWLDLPHAVAARIPEVRGFADDVRAAGFTHALVCGVGGSALVADVLRRSLGVARGWLDVAVLDSTDPAAVLAAERRSDPVRTLYVVAGKSGDEVELQALLAFFWDRLTHLVGERAPNHFVALTDAGSALERLARERRFRRVFTNPPDLAGRYGALSVASLVPAALMGHDVDKLVARAQRMLVACGPRVRAAKNPAHRLGAVLAAAARTGRDKLTFAVADKIAAFADWAEQLLAESTGKDGRGIVPVTAEPLAPAAAYGKDRLFVGMRVGTGGGRTLAPQARAGHPVVALRLNDAYDLGGEFLRWEIATAVAGHLLGLEPFDEPDVQAARASAGDGASRPRASAAHSIEATDLAATLWSFLAAGPARRYVALAAFVAPSPRRAKLLAEARARIRRHVGVATTLGYGPRLLHATGRLHEEGPAAVAMIQLVAEDPVDMPVPGSASSFGALKNAQAVGEVETLGARGRRVLRIHLGRNVERGLELLLAALARRPHPRRGETTRAVHGGAVRARAGRRR